MNAFQPILKVWFDSWMSSRVQGVAFAIVALVLLAIYWRFFCDLVRFLLDRPVQAFAMILLYALIFGQVGTGLGIPFLFWNEEPFNRFSASLGATLLLALIGINAYYLLPQTRQAAVMGRVEQFLQRRQVLRLPWRILEVNPDRDPIAWELSQFLRLARLPFLTLLALPAWLPALFTTVPRYAPVEHAPGFFSRLYTVPDVTRDGGSYLIGLAVWVAGIFAGLLLVKLAVWVSSWHRPAWLFASLLGLSLGIILDLWSLPRFVVWPAILATAVVSRFLLRWLEPIAEAFPTDAWPWGMPDLAPEKRRSIRDFFACVLIGYLLLATVFYDDAPLSREVIYPGVAPGLVLCALLGMLAMVSVAFTLLLAPRLRLPGLGLLLFIIGCSNGDTFKLRFENLAYQRPVLLDGESLLSQYQMVEGPRPGLVADQTALTAWESYARAGSSTPERKPKLAVVCVTGGAIRSAYWSAVVLDRLGREIEPSDSFHRHVRVMTGASGGMVGTAYYLRWLGARLGLGKEFLKQTQEWRWIDEIPSRGLWPVARFMALRESWRMFFPRFGKDYEDRGIALEKSWPHLREVKFSDYRDLEAAGKVPSLIFSPMTIEDGRRLLLSNLDLRHIVAPPRRELPRALALTRGNELVDRLKGSRSRDYSLSAIELRKVLPDAGDLLLSTPARMSATFPFVSPAVYLPTDPPLRVVDAGYFDNYGVSLAASWLFMNREWLAGHTSGVVLVQIRDALSHQDRLGFPSADDGSWLDQVLKRFQFFVSPVDAILEARTTSSMFRNDQEVSGLCNVFENLTGDPDFFTTAIFENSANVTNTYAVEKEHDWIGILKPETLQARAAITTNVTMSWYLTRAELHAMDAAIPTLESIRNLAEVLVPELPAFPGGPVPSLAERVARCESILRDRAESQSDRLIRAYYFRQYQRVRNFQKLDTLNHWWAVDHTVDPARQLTRAVGQGLRALGPVD